MKVKFHFLIGIIFYGLLLTGCTSKEIKASEVIDLVQSNYTSIEIKDKILQAGSDEQYLIDDFIAKLSWYKLKEVDEIDVDDYSTKITMTYKDGSKIILIDNSYLMVDDKTYEIVEGEINLEKFYKFIE